LPTAPDSAAGYGLRQRGVRWFNDGLCTLPSPNLARSRPQGTKNESERRFGSLESCALVHVNHCRSLKLTFPEERYAASRTAGLALESVLRASLGTRSRFQSAPWLEWGHSSVPFPPGQGSSGTSFLSHGHVRTPSVRNGTQRVPTCESTTGNEEKPPRVRPRRPGSAPCRLRRTLQSMPHDHQAPFAVHALAILSGHGPPRPSALTRSAAPATRPDGLRSGQARTATACRWPVSINGCGGRR